MFVNQKRKAKFNGAILLFLHSCFFGVVFASIQLSSLATTQSNNAVPGNTRGSRVAAHDGADSKLSVLAEQMRSRPPNAYCVRIESCTELMTKKPTFQKYETRPFSVGGFNWTFILEPFGSTTSTGTWISAYVAIDPSGLVGENHEVYAGLSFLVYSKTLDQYWTSTETEIRRFHQSRTVWGNPTYVRHVDFQAPGREYIFDNDQCVFGVDINVYPYINKWEVLSRDKTVYVPNSWKLLKFSTLNREVYVSDEFSAGGKIWAFKVYPNCKGAGEGNSLSLFVILSGNQTLKPYEKVYLRAKLRVLDQKKSNHLERPIVSWFDSPGQGSCFEQFVSLADLGNPARGFIVDDALSVQVQFETLSSTNFYSSSAAQFMTMSSTF